MSRDFEFLKMAVGKTIESVKDLTEEGHKTTYQINFEDSSIMIVSSYVEGYDFDFAGININLYETH